VEAVVTETDNESTAIPEIKPIDAGPELGRFMTAMRRLQDIVVSTNPDDTLWADAAGQVEDLCARLEVHRAPQGVVPAGRGPHLPGLGHPLMPPWMMTEAGPDGVTMQGHFSRFHVGGNNARPRWCDTTVLRLALRHARLRGGPPEQPNRLPARVLPAGNPDRRTTSVPRTDRFD
jgi:hypothetical protein